MQKEIRALRQEHTKLNSKLDNITVRFYKMADKCKYVVIVPAERDYAEYHKCNYDKDFIPSCSVEWCPYGRKEKL